MESAERKEEPKGLFWLAEAGDRSEERSPNGGAWFT